MVFLYYKGKELFPNPSLLENNNDSNNNTEVSWVLLKSRWTWEVWPKCAYCYRCVLAKKPKIDQLCEHYYWIYCNGAGRYSWHFEPWLDNCDSKKTLISLIFEEQKHWGYRASDRNTFSTSWTLLRTTEMYHQHITTKQITNKQSHKVHIARLTKQTTNNQSYKETHSKIDMIR